MIGLDEFAVECSNLFVGIVRHVVALVPQHNRLLTQLLFPFGSLLTWTGFIQVDRFRVELIEKHSVHIVSEKQECKQECPTVQLTQNELEALLD